MGWFGIGLGALILLFVKEPPRAVVIKPNKPKKSSFSQFKESLADIWRSPTSRNVTIASMFSYIGGFAMMYYMPSFF
jgi:hypothetical protein